MGCSTSAVSTHLQKLEEQAGPPLLRTVGRGLALTDAGETMLAYARRLLDLNDEAAAAVQGIELEGWVRLGLQEDFGETLLPEVLGRFARAHPKVRIEAQVVRNAELMERVVSGRLDLALAWSDCTRTPHCEVVAEIPMCWVGPAGEPGLLTGDRRRSSAARFTRGTLLDAESWDRGTRPGRDSLATSFRQFQSVGIVGSYGCRAWHHGSHSDRPVLPRPASSLDCSRPAGAASA